MKAKEWESPRREQRDFRAGWNQAVSGAHKPVAEPISTKLHSRTQQLLGK